MTQNVLVYGRRLKVGREGILQAQVSANGAVAA